MRIVDEIDGPAIYQDLPDRRRTALRLRVLLYGHLLMVVPSVIFGRNEAWFAHLLEDHGFLRDSIEIATELTVASLFVFPFMVYLSIPKSGSPGQGRDWIAFPLSLAISFVQGLAFLPAVQ